MYIVYERVDVYYPKNDLGAGSYIPWLMFELFGAVVHQHDLLLALSEGVHTQAAQDYES